MNRSGFQEKGIVRKEPNNILDYSRLEQHFRCLVINIFS